MIKFFIIISLSLATFSQGMIKATVALTGNVFDQVSKRGETCSILVTTLDGKKATATRSIGSQDGYYYLAGLKPGVTYNIMLKKKGYMIETHKVSVPNSDKYVELSQDFQIKPMREGVMIPFSVTPFELNKSRLRIGSDIFLQGILLALEQNENVKVEIVCFPDAVEQNIESPNLTTERAKSIKDWLVSEGIPADRLMTKGEAKVDPKNPPPTEKASKGKRYIGPCYYKIAGV